MNPADSAGLSMRLAEFVTRTPDSHLPPQTLQAAARVVLDATGVMRAASGLAPEVLPFIALAGEGGTGAARVLGTRIAARAELAALANGAMAHALDYEDAFDGAPLHPNASLVPAVLALAQTHAPVTGREFLAAIAMGCDVACRVALSLRQRLEDGGWYPPPILGAFGAVAGAARILRLTSRQLLDAWSLLLLQNSCAGEIKHDPGTVIRAVREAFPAQAAVQVALLARSGVRGFNAPLEGRDGFYRLFAANHYDAGTLFRNLGAHWHIEDLSFKPWPSCRGTHAAIECALQMRRRVDWRLIRQIRIEGCEVHRMLAEPADRKRAPQTGIDAKFSLPFTVATAMVRGQVDLDSFAAPALADSNVLSLATLSSFHQRADWSAENAVSGAVELTLADGRCLRHEVVVPRGAPARPLTEAELVAKFVDCAGRAQHALPAAQATALATRILRLEFEAEPGGLMGDDRTLT
jgi:2-methylcitrate dehydratase PrpD